METIKVGLFDDHPSIIEGVKNTIFVQNSNIEILFEANKKVDLFKNLELHNPDILVLDIVSDDVSGLENFEKIHNLFPLIKIIAHSSLNNVVLIENLLSLKVKGFVNKKQKISDLIQCILEVYKGKISIPSEFQFLTSKFKPTSTVILTTREIEIISLIAKEFSTQNIAQKLDLSVNTIESHRKRIFQKLTVKNAAGMVMEATRLGYLK